MYYLFTLPFILTAGLIRVIARYFKVKSLEIISNVIIIVGVILFIYLYLDYNGFNILDNIRTTLGL